MPPSRNLNRYNDIRPLLDVALSRGECVFTADTQKIATNTRQRLNALIRLLEQDNPTTPYAGLMISRPSPKTLIVTPRRLQGTIETPHDEADLIQPADPFAEAEAMMAELKLDED